MRGDTTLLYPPAIFATIPVHNLRKGLILELNTLPPSFADKNVCILGLGFVGLTLATVMADVGFHITGVEIRDEVLGLLKSGDPHFFEPGLSNHLKHALKKGHLTVFKEIPPQCKATVFIVTVGTPLGSDGRVNLASITHIAHEIAAHLKDGDMVIMRSTLKLGTTRQVIQPILDKTGKTYSLAFCPERTVEGQAISELRYLPQIIGADDRNTANRAAQLFQMITPTVVRVSDFETGEMIKLIDNAKRDVMFAYANEVARLCDTLGISAEEVITSGRFGYSRTDLPMPGPVGGPCLSKDSHILAESFESYDVTPAITLAARKVNEEQPLEIARFLQHKIQALHFPERFKIAFLGIAFKGQPETDDVRGTVAIQIIDAIRNLFPGAYCHGYDPVVSQEAMKELGLVPEQTLANATQDASLTVIMNNHAAFSKMPLEELAQHMTTPAIIYDFWNLFTRSRLQLPENIQYIALGSHQCPIMGTEPLQNSGHSQKKHSQETVL